jgi:putative SbcD/Mre11-related phosphoesterase
MKNYYIKNNIAFVHGHKPFEEIFDKKIDMIVMAHIHPSVVLSDKKGVKKEKFKCFLIGEFRGKRIIILPSFFEIFEGMDVNDYIEEYESYFSIIPKKSILKFRVYAVGEKGVYDFGMIKDLR